MKVTVFLLLILLVVLVLLVACGASGEYSFTSDAELVGTDSVHHAYSSSPAPSADYLYGLNDLFGG